MSRAAAHCSMARLCDDSHHYQLLNNRPWVVLKKTWLCVALVVSLAWAASVSATSRYPTGDQTLQGKWFLVAKNGEAVNPIARTAPTAAITVGTLTLREPANVIPVLPDYSATTMNVGAGCIGAMGFHTITTATETTGVMAFGKLIYPTIYIGCQPNSIAQSEQSLYCAFGDYWPCGTQTYSYTLQTSNAVATLTLTSTSDVNKRLEFTNKSPIPTRYFPLIGN